MNSNRKTAIIVGILFIIATAFFVIGTLIFEPVFASEDYLKTAFQSKTIVTFGVLIELMAVFAIFLIPAFLFRILKKYSVGFAMSYVCLRLIEAVFLTISCVGTLSLVDISNTYVSGGFDETYRTIADGIQFINDWSFTLSVSFFFTIGTLLVNYIFYKTKLIPRFISVWGVLAAILLLIGSLILIFDVAKSSAVLESVFSMPIALQEMVLAVWLIVKGFNENIGT
jgi:hypothetical protein